MRRLYETVVVHIEVANLDTLTKSNRHTSLIRSYLCHLIMPLSTVGIIETSKRIQERKSLTADKAVMSVDVVKDLASLRTLRC